MVEVSPVSPDRVARLKEIGLSDYQARAYLAALAIGAGTARDLASVSGVPRPKMYETLESLLAKGLVEAVLSKPTRYRAVPLEVHLASLSEELRNRAARLDAMQDQLAAHFRPSEDPAEAAGAFRSFKGRRSIHAKVAAMANAARRDLLIIGTAASAERIARSLLATVRDRATAGVAVRILLPVTRENRPDVEAVARRTDVRHMEREPGTFSVHVDGREAILTHEAPDGRPVRGGEVGIWTDDPAVVRLLSGGLEALWEAAVPVADRLRELDTGEKPERVELVRDPGKAAALLADLTRNFERSLRVATSEMGVYQLQAARPVLKAKAANGLRARVLVPVTPNNRGVVAGLLEVADVRHIEALPGRFVLADKTTALVTDAPAKDVPFLDKDAFSTNTVVARHRGYVAMLEMLFEQAWEKAEPAEPRVTRA